MPLYQRLSFDEEKCTVAIWQIAESEDELMAPLPNGQELLTEARARFKAVGRRLEWLAVRRLMYEVGIGSPIAYHPSGRPCLVNDARHISISHTRGYAAVAIREDAPVGLDIEQLTQKVCRVQHKFLSHEEKLFLLLEKKNVEALHLIWTAKEAMFKLVDREGIDFAAHFHVSPFTVADEGHFVAHETFTEDNHSFHFFYHIFPDFVMNLSFFS